MKILDRLRNRSPRGAAGDPGSAEPATANEQSPPIPGYDRLNSKQVTDQLSQLSQVELATVEIYERAHGNHPAVLDKLRYMRGSEPLPGYDALSPDEIATALSGADAETVKAVRDYERKFAHRRQVMEEAARVLPTARASAGEARAREDKAALVQAGIRSDPPATRADLDGPPAMKTESHRSRFDRVDAAQEERNERERLRDEARYRRERLDLYQARLYGGRVASQGKLRELHRASDGAAARLRRAEAAAPPTDPPT
jgi:hypothetical protein